ncbi:caspase family protein [Pannonibacter sp. Pt2-lr]
MPKHGAEPVGRRQRRRADTADGHTARQFHFLCNGTRQHGNRWRGLNSPYSAAIAREILVPGASIETVFKRVRQDVVTATDGAQVPWDHSSLTTDIILTPAADSGQAEVPVLPLRPPPRRCSRNWCSGTG